MARENILIHDRLQPYELETPIVETTDIEVIKDLFVNTLRESFGRHPIFTWVPKEDDPQYPDFDKTQIVITDVYRYDAVFLPVITVRINSSNYHPISFNQDLFKVEYLLDENGRPLRQSNGAPIPNYYEFVGGWDSTVTLEVNAESVIDREQLVAITKIIFMNIKRDELYRKGIHVIRVGHGGESETPYHNDYIYKQTVNVEVYSEWTNRIPVGELLEAIDVQVSGPISRRSFISRAFGGKIEDLPISFIDTSRDLRPSDVCETIEFNESAGKYDIVEEWREIIERSFELSELHTLFGITQFDDLSTEDFLFALIIAHSASRTSLAEIAEDINNCIVELGANAQSYGYGDSAEVIELRRLRDQLYNRFFNRVKRNVGEGAPIDTKSIQDSEVVRYLKSSTNSEGTPPGGYNLPPMANPTDWIYRNSANARYWK